MGQHLNVLQNFEKTKQNMICCHSTKWQLAKPVTWRRRWYIQNYAWPLLIIQRLCTINYNPLLIRKTFFWDMHWAGYYALNSRPKTFPKDNTTEHFVLVICEFKSNTFNVSIGLKLTFISDNLQMLCCVYYY